MAYDVSALTAFVDEQSASDDIWQKLILGDETSKFLKVFNTKYNTLKVPTMVGDRDIFQDNSSCAKTPSGNDDFTQESITLANIIVLKEYCMQELEATYTGTYLPQGQTYNDALQVSFDETIRQIVAQNELNAWLGDTGGSGSLALQDGFVKLIGATNAAKCLTGDRISFGAITSTTALAFVEGLVDAVMDDVDMAASAITGNLLLFISPADKRNYDLNYRTVYGDNTNAKDFNEALVAGTNIKFAVVGGLTGTDFMCISPVDNLSTAVDLISDETSIDGGMTEYKTHVWLKSVFKKGYGARNYSQVAFHRLLT